MKILLADDSTHAQRMGAKILAGEGIEVVSVSNGEAAVKKLQELDFDLVLADVYMPGLDGYEVCQWVKKSEAHTGLPVVLVVGALEIMEAERIEQVRADGLLKKPFEASAMLATVRPLLESSAASKPSRKKMEPDHDAKLAEEKTVVIRPPQGSKQSETVSEATTKHDDTAEIDPKDQPAAGVEPPPAPGPEPPASEGPPTPPTEELPPMAEMEMPAFEEQTGADFTIPDVTPHEEQSLETTLLQAPQWVAEPVQVTDEDRSKFEPTAMPARVVPEAPPDWGDLLKSVEEGSGHLPAATSPATTAAAAVEVHEPAASSDLELEMAEPIAVPPPPPAIDEEELRMTVQLCLENALPGLVDEITSAVLRRIGNSQ